MQKLTREDIAIYGHYVISRTPEWVGASDGRCMRFLLIRLLEQPGTIKRIAFSRGSTYEQRAFMKAVKYIDSKTPDQKQWYSAQEEIEDAAELLNDNAPFNKKTAEKLRFASTTRIYNPMERYHGPDLFRDAYVKGLVCYITKPQLDALTNCYYSDMIYLGGLIFKLVKIDRVKYHFLYELTNG